MHQILHIEEVLINVFGYCGTPVDPSFGRKRRHRYANVTLTALARTCKAFREPALDMIWSELEDLTPLVRCLPDESWKVHKGKPCGDRPIYSLKKPLDQSDWAIILGYTRRIRALRCLYHTCGLAIVSIEALSKPSAPTESIFPNLHTVELFAPSAAVEPLMPHMAHPKVMNILIDHSGDLSSATIESFGTACPFVTDFETLHLAYKPDGISSLICHWQNLRVVNCHKIALDADAISHLSRLYRLNYLAFRVQESLVDQICAMTTPSILTLPALKVIGLFSPSFALVWRLLRHFHLPTISTVAVELDVGYTTLDLMPFSVALQKACSHVLLKGLYIDVPHMDSPSTSSEENFRPYYITFDRLLPLTVFANIRSIRLSVPCCVDINECELLTLASSWPRLEEFDVGSKYDWTMTSVITPSGFLQLLERCRSLKMLCFTLDTRGFTEIPQGHPWRGLKMPRHTYIDLLVSPIEEESVEALGVFFHVAPYPDFVLTAHLNHSSLQGSTGLEGPFNLHQGRWMRVYNLAHRLWRERKDLRCSLEKQRAV